MSTIGTRIKELRQSRGLSQQALAGDGISPAYVSLIESGKRTPSEACARRLAERLGVPAEQLLAETPSREVEEARVEVNFAKLALRNSNPREAIRLLDKVDLSRLDSRTANEAALVLAESLHEDKKLDEAVDVLESLIARCRTEGSWLILAQAATTLAAMYIDAGDIARSVEIADSATREVESAGLEGTDEHLRLGSTLVSALLERGDALFATRQVEGLIRVADRVGSPRARGSVYWNAATVAHERDRIADAIRLTDRAVALLGDQEQSLDVPRLRMNYAWLLLHSATPRPTEALQQLDRAQEDPLLVASQLDRGTAATLRGRAHLLLGELIEASEHAASAVSVLGGTEHIERATALVLLGDVGSAMSDLELAHECYDEAERVMSRMVPSRKVARLWRELGDSWRDLHEAERAFEAYDRSFHVLGIEPRPMASRLTEVARSGHHLPGVAPAGVGGPGGSGGNPN